VAGAFMALSEAELAAASRGARVPLYRSPVEAARALARVTRYAHWRARPDDGGAPPDGVDADAAAAVLAAALVRGETLLKPDETRALLGAYGIPTDPDDGDEEIEMVAGVLADPDLGPVVACGLGGRTVELLGDVAVRLAPLGRHDAHELVRSLRAFPVLQGYRGGPKADVGALEDLLVRLSALAAAHPEVVEIDCDPLLVSPRGAAATDARVRVRAATPPRPFPALDR
jgi:acyl-CoA synthetase (NDP forming)